MDVYVYDKSLNRIAVIDSFTSLIWTKRYYECGDFELYIPASSEQIGYLQPDYFLMRDDDDSAMCIESIETDTDAENGDYFIISGRCMKSVLLRRVFSRQFVLDNHGTLNAAVQSMVAECTTVHNPNPHYPMNYREIPGLSVDFTTTFDGNLKAQFTGQTLLDGILSITMPREIGTKISVSGSNLILELFKGSDRGVIFSPDFDNLISSKYVVNKSNYANRAYIAGEGEGSARRWAGVSLSTIANPDSGFDLHELFVDARDISSNNGEIDASDYSDMLISRGKMKLSEHDVSKTFEAEIETMSPFVYKRDYDLGDIVNISNQHGVSIKPRIVEIIESWDSTGYKCIPKFDSLEV